MTEGEVQPMSKRRKGFPSEVRVTRGGGKTNLGEEFLEKLGRGDLCPCGSGSKFKNCCLKNGKSKPGDDYYR